MPERTIECACVSRSLAADAALTPCSASNLFMGTKCAAEFRVKYGPGGSRHRRVLGRQLDQGIIIWRPFSNGCGPQCSSPDHGTAHQPGVWEHSLGKGSVSMKKDKSSVGVVVRAPMWHCMDATMVTPSRHANAMARGSLNRDDFPGRRSGVSNQNGLCWLCMTSLASRQRYARHVPIRSFSFSPGVKPCKPRMSYGGCSPLNGLRPPS